MGNLEHCIEINLFAERLEQQSGSPPPPPSPAAPGCGLICGENSAMPTQSCMARRESHVLLLMRVLLLLLLLLRCLHSYPKGYAAPSVVPCQCNMRRSPSKLKRALPQSKIDVTSKSPVGDISVVTLIRTDTTLDHSQKAEKVWFSLVPGLLSMKSKFA